MDIAEPIAPRPCPFRKLSMPPVLTLDSISLPHLTAALYSTD